MPAVNSNDATAHLQAIIDAMPVAICVSDAAGQLFIANAHFARTFDVSTGDRWVDSKIADLKGVARFSTHHTPLKLAERGQCTLTVFTESAVKYVACDELLSAATHDLRTPLNAMTGWLHLLEHSAAQPMADKAKAGIRRAIEHQTRVVNELSQFVQLSKGHIQLALQKADLTQLLQDLLASQDTAAGSSTLAMRFATDFTDSLAVNIDVELICSVLQVIIGTFRHLCTSTDFVTINSAQLNGFANLSWRRYDSDGVQLSLGSSFGASPRAASVAGAGRQSLLQMRAALLLGLHRGFITLNDERSVNNATLTLSLPAA